MYHSCQEAYLDGVNSRLKYPLRSGHYKLVESQDRIERAGREVVRISEVVSKRRDPRRLLHCTSQDKAIWLRRLPLDVAFRLGYEIVPSFRALKADGVASIHSESAAKYVESVADSYLGRWEKLRNSYLNKINNEYDSMRNGNSNALIVVHEALHIVEHALILLPSDIRLGFKK